MPHTSGPLKIRHRDGWWSLHHPTTGEEAAVCYYEEDAKQFAAAATALAALHNIAFNLLNMSDMRQQARAALALAKGE